MYRFATLTLSILTLVVVSTLQAADTGVTGRVVRLDENGIPVGMAAGARLEIKDQRGARVADVMADANGLVKIDLPGAGRYFYVVDGRDEGRGFEHTLSTGYASYSFFIIDHDKPPSEPIYQRAGTLRGRVFEQTASGDAGIPRAVITLRKVGTRELTRVITQAASADSLQVGQYQVILDVGTYLASVSARGFERLVDPEPIEIVADQAATRDFVLSRPAPPPDLVARQGIRGLVAVVKNGGTIPPPFPVRVDIRRALGGDVLYTTAPGDSRGAFSQNTAPGMYRVVAYAPDNGYHQAVSPPIFVFPRKFSYVKLILRPEESDVDPQPTDFTIEVQVVNLDGEHALAAAEVRLRKKDQPISEALRATTGADGVATFLAHKPGAYLTLAQAKGYKSAGREFQAGAEDPSRVQIALARTTAPDPASPYIRVTVREAKKNRPLPNAGVLVHREDLSARDGTRRTTDDNGQAKVHVEPGAFVVLAGAPGYRVERATVRVGRAEETRVELRLNRMTGPTPGTVAVTGKVDYEPPPGLAGYALISQAVMQWKRTEPIPGLPRTVITDEIGQYRIDLREGTYTVNIKPPNENFLPLTAIVRVRPGMGPKDFTLRSHATPPTPGGLVDVGGFVLGRAADRLRAVPESVVQWRRADGGPPVVQTDKASRMGRYNVRLPAGAYEVTITPPKPYLSLTEKIRVYDGMRAQNFTLKSAEDDGTPPERLVTVNGVVVGTKPPARLRIPVAGAEVLWIRPGQTAKATSGRDGRFQVRLVLGVYRVIAKAKGYAGLDTKVSVRSDMSTVSLALQAVDDAVRPTELTVDLRIIEQKLMPNRRQISIPLRGARILIRQRTKVVTTGSSDSKGHFRAKLSPGSYDVNVTHQGHATQAASISLSTVNLTRDIVMRRSQVTPPSVTKQGLTLRVVASALTRPGIRPIPRGVSQADVVVMKGNARVAAGKTDGNGIYRTTLVSGVYQVKVSGSMIRPAGSTVNVGTSDVTQQITVQRVSSERPLVRPPIRSPTRFPLKKRRDQ